MKAHFIQTTRTNHKCWLPTGLDQLILKHMTLIRVKSSAIRAVGYDGYTLTVEFHTGRIYSHPGVPYQVYREFMHAQSMGAYHNRYIRGRYRLFNMSRLATAKLPAFTGSVCN